MSIELTQDHVFQTYSRQGRPFVKGRGTKLYDDQGNEYTDFLAGIAVCSMGHCHPDITAAICAQAATLVHVSNLFYTRPQAELAKVLTEKSFADRVFFANSGAEANEAAIKLARRFFQAKGETDRFKIVTMQQSFHGRTMATLSATGQDKIKKGFYPLLDGFIHVPFNDIEALKAVLDDTVCAVMMEPVQGEGGVIPADPEYIKAVRQLCTDTGTLLVFDEIQTGMGRCGTLFAHESYDVTPDIMTLAKALANGVPIGAMLATETAAQGFDIGSHATTFGGTPIATAAGLEMIRLICQEGLLASVREKSAYFLEQLNVLKEKHQKVVDVRGRGLLLGMELDISKGKTATEYVSECFKKGFIINAIQDKILRFAPPLIIGTAEINQLVAVLDSLFAGEDH
ncbi:aspartate aminotransferase family protein [Desulfobacter hydrogenophilus]|uniref:Acetylornithine aminotransferase n=1 Tax=Desulfobacter hydrogenophilus TaxID=2291 RepID=A0A328FGK1_9BACT|nr:aspartate aminotransferase family protein [Desulfobacter hydrogenophilus]NDY71806.1 aspartate aminotransferase family protein [Desulfobacter hydrogenophilus]QBH13503.1 aspartate aminotransferase family protein [Desulfobacter hydrogenophilus]RAM03754.1 aspartate aminotransferase family protein [Desulfobacter hydrogenophilus]